MLVNLILDESISKFRGAGLGGIFHFYSNFNRTFCEQTVEHPDQMPHSVASDLGHVPQKGC